MSRSNRSIDRQKRNTLKRRDSAEKAGISASETKGDLITTKWFYILKWVACITMLVDHIADCFSEICGISGFDYAAMRYVGRLAFPLFAYLMTESFCHTKSKGKHLLKIGILAVISEIPYDLAFSKEKRFIDWSMQNICVSLFLSFLLLMILDRDFDGIQKFYGRSKFGKLVQKSVKICIIGVFMALAYLARDSYKFQGVLLVAMLAYARNRKYRTLFQAGAFFIFGCLNGHIAYVMISISFLLIVTAEFCSKHQKRRKDKQTENPDTLILLTRKAASVFYPVHLLILVLVREAMILLNA